MPSHKFRWLSSYPNCPEFDFYKLEDMDFFLEQCFSFDCDSTIKYIGLGETPQIQRMQLRQRLLNLTLGVVESFERTYNNESTDPLVVFKIQWYE